MLSVSPPLHKDFHGRNALCSPGDGWRGFVPPPLPTVQPAFHFLSSLLEQSSDVSFALTLKRRAPMDPALHGSLARIISLPMEVLDLITAHVADTDSCSNLALTSRLFNRLATRHLFQHVRLTCHRSIALLSRTLQERPWLGQHLRQLSVDCQGPKFDQLNTLANALGGNAANVERLSVRFPCSDLHAALPFLSAFSPRSFEWETSPCWLMRPSHLFVQFLSGWNRLCHLSFANFRFDHVVVESIAAISTLEVLTLKGNGASHLDVSTLSSILLLNATPGRTHPLQVQVFDCPPPQRLLLDIQLQAALGEHEQSPLSKLTWL